MRVEPDAARERLIAVRVLDVLLKTNPMKHLPHASQASTDTDEIFAIARTRMEEENIPLDNPNYGAVLAAYMRTYTEAVKWRIAENPDYDQRDVL